MRTRPSSTCGIVWSLLRWTLLVPILFTFGCASKPNLFPEGYKSFLQFFPPSEARMVAKQAARLDYPVVVHVEDKATKFPIFWTKKGETIWTMPFWYSVTWWRIGVIAEGVPKALCDTDWKAVGTEDGNFTEVPCEMDVNKYLGIPLVVLLDYRLGGDKQKSPGDDGVFDGVARLYYLIQKGIKSPDAVELPEGIK